MTSYDSKANDSHDSQNHYNTTSNPFLTVDEIAMRQPVPRWALILHALAAFLSVISIVMLSYGTWEEKNANPDSFERQMFLALGVYPVIPFLCLSLIWSVVSVLFATISKTRLHLALYVSFDLFLWLGLIVTGCLALVFLQHNEAIRIVANAFGMVIGIFHFAIMVWACRVVDLARRRAKKMPDDIPLASRA